MGESAEEGVNVESSFQINEVIEGLIYNPVNLALLCVIFYLIYQLFSSRKETAKPVPSPQPLPPLKKQDMTAQQLRKFDGTNEDGRVCIAVNGKIFDCTKGKRHYGPGGPYAAFAGRDASRGFAKFSVEASDKDYDDLSDLTTMEMDSVREWEMQFQEKYDYVGRFLKPGEEPTDYSDEEDTSQEQGSQDLKSDSVTKVTSMTSNIEVHKESTEAVSKEESGSNVFQESTVKTSVPFNQTGDFVDSKEEIGEKEPSSAKLTEGADGEPVKEISDKKVD